MSQAKLDKKQKIFCCIPLSNFTKISTLNICDGAKQIYLMKQRRDNGEIIYKYLRRDNLQISVAAIQRCTVKKVSVKILPPVYLRIIKIDIKKWTITCLNQSKS